MENTYRDVNVALANEFAQICELLGVDGRTAIRFANKHPRVSIMNPGIGVGGHCIPVDPWFLKEIAPYNSRLIATARLINDEMPHHVAGAIRRSVAGLVSPRIVALGATYKKNCEDVRESPAFEIVRLLIQDGYQVAHYDPLVPGMRYPSLREIAAGADLIAVLVCHDAVRRELTAERAAVERVMRGKQITFFDE
jgi:UDP-N-acetyl-D-mannosaminuronic acid dehydrogenase